MGISVLGCYWPGAGDLDPLQYAQLYHDTVLSHIAVSFDDQMIVRLIVYRGA